MQVDNAMIDKLADLAKLEFSEEEKAHVRQDLTNMLQFIDTLKALEVDGVEPLVYINESTNVLRPDIPQMEITKDEALMNAPLADSDYFKVPKVLKK
ncbi:MAG: Asp-tRNA(Asn)/Glu-tRNA(Gln) amidotransferase subunit GatC [Chitinophagales bacterium]